MTGFYLASRGVTVSLGLFGHLALVYEDSQGNAFFVEGQGPYLGFTTLDYNSDQGAYPASSGGLSALLSDQAATNSGAPRRS